MQFSLPDRQFFRPRQVAVLLAVIGSALTAVLFYPISLVFTGDWKLNQKVDLASELIINFEALGISQFTNQLGLQPQTPFGPIPIRFYAMCIVLGLLAGYFLVLYLAKFHFIASTIIDRLVIGLVISGLLGARLFFVAFNWDLYAISPLSALTDITRGGLAIFGMILGAGGYLWYYCKSYKFKFFEFLDIIAPGVLLGQVIGRWGNFFNYESYGPQTTVFWKMFVPETANIYIADLNAKYFHPTFLYEIIPNFLLLIFLLYFYERLTEKHSGRVFALYAFGYGIIRFVCEFFRLDALKVVMPQFLQINVGGLFTLENILISQVAAVCLVITGIVVWVRQGKFIFLKKELKEFRID